MNDSPYRRAPDTVGMEKAERSIRMAGVQALVALGIAAPAAVYLLPLAVDFPEALPERLAFAAVASGFVWIWVLVGVGMVSTGRRFSPADIGGSAAGPPSERIAVRAAFLQNTLEQAGLAAVLYLALGALLSGPWLSLIVVGVLFFAVGRVLFLRGYRDGAPGRSLGMSLTLLPTALGYIALIALVLWRAF